jgi:hypothetical protein
MIFGQSWGEPWDGKHPGLVQGLTTGPPPSQVTGGPFLSVPGPRGTQIACGATLALVEKPPGACRRPAQPKRLGADEAWPLPALRSPQPREGLGGTDGHCHGPAGVILVEDVVGASGPSSGEQGFEGWGWVSWSGRCGRGWARTPPPHDPHETPRPHRVPPARPGWALGARGAGGGTLPWRAAPGASASRSGRLCGAGRRAAWAAAWAARGRAGR